MHTFTTYQPLKVLFTDKAIILCCICCVPTRDYHNHNTVSMRQTSKYFPGQMQSQLETFKASFSEITCSSNTESVSVCSESSLFPFNTSLIKIGPIKIFRNLIAKDNSLGTRFSYQKTISLQRTLFFDETRHHFVYKCSLLRHIKLICTINLYSFKFNPCSVLNPPSHTTTPHKGNTI